MAYLDLIQKIHRKTKRDYLKERVLGSDKASCAKIAKKFGKDYWDGDRKYGYGGYYYDGRWKSLAEKLATRYQLKPGHRVLDVGCGKGYLLYELTQVVPDLMVHGLDVSRYAIKLGKQEVKERLLVGNATRLPFKDKTFDLVVSINTLHNLYIYDLKKAVQQIERVGKRKSKYIVVDSYRGEREKVNLMYWQLTCECFYTPKEWEWLLKEYGYTGDLGCIYYE